MNKKIFALIIVILISFCFIGIAMADNATHQDNSTDDHDKPIDKDTSDKNKTPDKNKTDDKSKYILAQGSGNDIKFSDGFRGFRLDYSKPAATSGDEFKHASASSAPNSNMLMQTIIGCYVKGLSGQIGSIMSGAIQSGASGDLVNAAQNSEKINGAVKINNNTAAVFSFEVLESVSGNVSNYFAYTVSFRSISSNTNQTNLTNTTNATNVTNATNITNMTLLFDNETNATLLEELLDYLLFWADMLYGAWEPIIETLLNDFLIFYHALEELVHLFENFMAELQSMMDAVEKFLNMLASLWKEIDGLLKLLGVLLSFIQQIINLIGAILNFIVGLISAIIALIQQILGLLFALINFILEIINQILLLLQAILDFLKALGNVLVSVIENAVILIAGFVLITVGAFFYNRIRNQKKKIN